MRVAIVHDWLYVLGGAEKVLAGLLRLYPDADVFCLFDILPEADRSKVGLRATTTSFMQRLPAINRKHRSYLPLMPLAIEQFDLSGYDIVVSSSFAVAKGVLTGPDQLHVAYVHSPMRYAWDLQHQYLAQSGLDRGLKGWVARWLLHRIRTWDVRTASGVDAYIANSSFVARRIRKIYGQRATVIHPPVEVPPALRPATRGDYFFTASRLVAYKNVRAIVEAFRELPDQKLIVAGSGPDRAALEAIAGPNVTFLGFAPHDLLRQHMREARAFIFAAEEDFGIVPLEAQSEGTPVLALGRGGVRETIPTRGAAPTGMFFETSTATDIAATVRRFVAQEDSFSREACFRNALRFSDARFDHEFAAFMTAALTAFHEEQDAGLAPALDPGLEPEQTLPAAPVAQSVS